MAEELVSLERVEEVLDRLTIGQTEPGLSGRQPEEILSRLRAGETYEVDDGHTTEEVVGALDSRDELYREAIEAGGGRDG